MDQVGFVNRAIRGGAGVMLLTALLGMPVQAATVDLVAPDAAAKLLRTHAQVLKQPPPAIDAVEANRLRAAASEEFAALLATEGWFSPKFDFALRGSGEQAALTITVDPGAPVRVAAVDLRFDGDLGHALPAQEARRQVLRGDWSLPVGEMFTQAGWDGAKQSLLSAVSAQDYVLAQLHETAADIDPAREAASLLVRIDSGPPFRFGRTRYEGLEQVPADVLARLSRIEPGARFDRDQLLDFQAALQDSGYFSSVVVDTDLAAAADDPAGNGLRLADVRVQVREAYRHRVAFGAGASTETGAFFEASYGNLNFVGRGLDLRTGLRLDEQGGKAFADLYLPPNREGYRDSAGVGVESTMVEGLRTDRHAFGVRRTRQQGPLELQLGLRYLGERARDLVQDTRTSALALSWEWTQRAVDDRFDPRRGYVLNLGLTGGVRGLGSQTSFVRSYGKVQGYWTVRARDVLTARLEAGLTRAAETAEVPQEYLFRAGGVGSVRGYPYLGLGRRTGAAVRGERALATASVEYTHWRDETWGAAVFTDVGGVAGTWQGIDPVVGVGTGVRYRTPAGPLAVDLAWGERDRRWRLHFSVAITF